MSEGLSGVYLDWSSLMVVRPICAYIDPGTGSMVLQIVLGGVLASLVAIKLFWRQLKEFAGELIGRRSRSPDGQDPKGNGAETDHQERDCDVWAGNPWVLS